MVINSRIRWFGTLFLAIAAGQLIWGQTLLKAHLTGLAFVIYWLVCLAFTGLAMLAALLDLRSVRLRIRQQQLDLLQKAFHNVGSGKPGSRPGKNVVVSDSSEDSP